MSKVCNAIKKDDIKKKLNKLIHKSDIDNKEHLLKFCSDNNKIILSNFCEGETSKVPYEKLCSVECPPRTKRIGEFHTHPRRNDYLSKNDVMRAIEENLETTCIGYIKGFTKNIKCYDYPFNIDKQTADRHKKLANERNEKYIEVHDKCVDKKTKQYKEHTTTEQKNNCKTMLKNYNLIRLKNAKHRKKVEEQVVRNQRESCKEII